MPQGQFKLADAKPIGQFKLADAASTQPEVKQEGPESTSGLFGYLKGIYNFSPGPLIADVFTDSNEQRKKAADLAAKGQYGQAIVASLKSAPSAQVLRVLGNMGRAQWEELKQGWEGVKAGEPAAAFGHGLAGLTPLVGPAAAAVVDKAKEGNYAEAAGMGTMLAAPGLIKAGRSALSAVKGRGLPPVSNTVATDLAFADRQGIPIDAATRTDSNIVRQTQKHASNTLGGAPVAERFQAEQAGALDATGRRLAAQVSPTQASPVSATRAVVTKLQTVIGDFNKAEATAYADLDQMFQKNQQVRSARPGQPFRKMEGPVDITSVRNSVRPLYDQLLREKELTGALQGAKGRALVKLDAIMRGPDFVPFSVADSARSALLEIVRGRGDRQFMNAGESVASRLAGELDARIKSAASQAGGQKALDTLRRGRDAVVEKYGAQDVLDMLSSDEPGKVFQELTARKDTALYRLEAVKKLAPAEIPTVARAFIEQLIDKATDEGGFKRADGLYADWMKLGDESKRVLFGSKTAELDSFFRLAKKIATNPNPSGTAYAMTATNVLASVPGYVLARILYSPGGARVLTNVLSTSPLRAAQNVGFASELAGMAGLAPGRVPALASGMTDAEAKK
jgi:hypothetical protein